MALRINTLLDTYQSSPAALRAKGSLCCTRIKHEPQPEIYIHYLGMHAFHLQHGGTGAALIFKPFPRPLPGEKTRFSSLRVWIWHVGSHVWTESINHGRLSLIWSLRRNQPTAAGTEFRVACVCRVSRRSNKLNCSKRKERRRSKVSTLVCSRLVFWHTFKFNDVSCKGLW